MYGRLRAIDAETVQKLAESIREVGLLHPIVVRPGKVPWKGITVDGYLVVCGGHRLEACRALGWADVPAIVTDMDTLHEQLAEVDENLCGTKLTPAERALFTRRRKEIYLQINPETKHGAIGGGHDQSRKICDSGKADRFTMDTAERTGRSERAIQLEAARGEKIDGQVLAEIKGTSLDKGVELDALARLQPEDQRELADKAKSGQEVSARALHQQASGERVTIPLDPVKAAEALCRVFDVEQLATLLAILLKSQQRAA